MYISMYLLKMRVTPAELSARLSSIKVPVSGASAMARRSLPSIEPLPNMTPPPASLLQATSIPKHAAPSSAPPTGFGCSAHTDTSKVAVSTASLSTGSGAAPQTLEVVIISTDNNSSLDQSADSVNIVAPLSVPEYKLSEIVSREREQLFQEEAEFELEPPREGVYFVRRRSRQFFTVPEEEDDANSDNNVPMPFEKYKGGHVEGGTVLVDPVFNLGESLHRLYFPNDYRKKKSKRKMKGKKAEKETEEPALAQASDTAPDTSGYESDPMGCATLFEKVSTLYSMRRVQSQPEIEEMAEIARSVDTFDYSTLSKSKSLPTTPSVSPKLLRKVQAETTDNIEDKRPAPVHDVTGPGFSFLASVAGDVRLHKAKQERQRQDEIRKRQEKSAQSTSLAADSQLVHAKHSNSQTVLAQKDSINVSSKNAGRSSSSPDITSHSSSFQTKTTDISSSDSSSKSFVKNIMTWGTTKKVGMSSKESNMFSPTSF